MGVGAPAWAGSHGRGCSCLGGSSHGRGCSCLGGLVMGVGAPAWAG